MSSPAAAAADKPRVLDIHDILKPPAERRHSTSPRPAERIYRKTDIDRLLERAAFDCRLVQARDLLPEPSDGDSTSEDEVEPVSDSEPREEGLGANAGSFPRPASRSLRKHSEPQCVEPRQKTFRGEEATLVWRRNDMDKHLGLRRSKRMSEESEDEIEYPRGRHAPIQNVSTNEGPASRGNQAKTIRGPEDMPLWWRMRTAA